MISIDMTLIYAHIVKSKESTTTNDDNTQNYYNIHRRVQREKK